MTQELAKETENIFAVEEVHEMFDTHFLPKLQEFARRAKNTRLQDKNVEFFNVQMILQFSELEKPLTYEMIKDKIQMQLQPVTDEDLEKSKQLQEKDLGDTE